MSVDWDGDFGNEYTKRNRVAWQKRLPFFETILSATAARSIFEVGCNAGFNLLALRHIDETLRLSGCDVNGTALREARAQDLNVSLQALGELRDEERYDLVFSAGVLIHIPPDDLPVAMQAIVNASRCYVLAVEYEDSAEKEIVYRGHAGALWKRPFGKLYEAMGLKVIQTGALSKDDGFDDCTYWLCEK